MTITRLCRLCAVAGVFSCIALAANAQTPPGDGFDHTYDEIIGPQKIPELFDPAKHGMTIVENPDRFYELLTEADRCPPKKTAKPRVPCALISYAPPGTVEAAYSQSLRPVFKVVDEDTIWTFLNGTLALAGVHDLWNVQDLTDPNDPDRPTYDPTALVGQEENQEHCAKSGGLACVEERHFLTFVRQAQILTPGCVDEIWNNRGQGGPTDSGQQSRCRFLKRADIKKADR